MNELTRFITETPLWLTIIFFAVFAAMSIWWCRPCVANDSPEQTEY